MKNVIIKAGWILTYLAAFMLFAAPTITKRPIGKQDLSLQEDNVAAQTFTAPTSTGGTMILDKIGGGTFPWDNSYTRTIRPGNIITRGPWVAVRSYGADPTGVPDSTAAIQAAINSVAVTGGTVYIPLGTYYVSSQLYYFSASSGYGFYMIG